MDLRKEFVLAAKAPGANVSEICREFGISRTNGYKWLCRYKAEGVAGLDDRSRRPHRVVGTDGETVLRLIELRREHPKWGPKKLRKLLETEAPGAVVPSVKTISRILDRAGEPRVRRRKRRLHLVLRHHQELAMEGPNDVWTVDFKGWWRTVDGRRYEPLTVRDGFSRFILCLRMLDTLAAEVVRPVFLRLFKTVGLPKVIRVDNGAPFACTAAPCGLSRLSAWWTALGIEVSFSRPGHPQDNGAHERMHADMAAELEADPADSIELQQRAADKWRREFNEVRPHEALGMKTPSAVYVRSSRAYASIRAPNYLRTAAVRRVTRNGCVRFNGRMVFVSESVAGYDVAVHATLRNMLKVRFYDLDLGTFEIAGSPQQHRPRLIPLAQLPLCKRKSA